jgi:hypothetical protein
MMFQSMLVKITKLLDMETNALLISLLVLMVLFGLSHAAKIVLATIKSSSGIHSLVNGILLRERLVSKLLLIMKSQLQFLPLMDLSTFHLILVIVNQLNTLLELKTH